MVKYIILADSINRQFQKEPRQLLEINGEPIIKRTIRLLKENGVKEIIITSHDKRFDDLGAERYEPLYNEYDPVNDTGYWLNAFPIELLKEPVCFLFGDVYYSDEAIKTIVESDTDSTLFFCTYENHRLIYIKHHDEPLAYKVKDYKLFKKHIDIVKKSKDEGKCCREPLVWELYRSINNQEINEHKMTENYIAINDISCDIDTLGDIMKLTNVIGGIEMVKCEVIIKEFNLAKFDELKNIKRKNKDEEGKLFEYDTFECSKEMADYLTGNNPLNKAVVRVIEVIQEAKVEEPKTEDKPIEIKPKKSKKKNKK